MKIEVGQYGQTLATLQDGTVLRLGERRGRLEVSAYNGALVVRPTSTNSVELTTESYFPKHQPTEGETK